MEKSVLRSCLIFLATVKKRLVLSDSVFVAWGVALRDLPHDLGRLAFNRVLREEQFGEVEPAHILKAADQITQEKIISSDGNAPWISKAAKFYGEVDHVNPTEEHRRWKREEAKKNYRSVDSETGEIFLIQNPASWEYRTDENGRPTVIAREKVATGQFIKKKSNKRAD